MLAININSEFPKTGIERPSQVQFSQFHEGRITYQEFTENPHIKEQLFRAAEGRIRPLFGEICALTTVAYGWPSFYHELGVERCHGVDLNRNQLEQFLNQRVLTEDGDYTSSSLYARYHSGVYSLSLGNLTDYKDVDLRNSINSANLIDLSNIPDYLSEGGISELAAFYGGNIPAGAHMIITSTNLATANKLKSALTSNGLVTSIKSTGQFLPQNPSLYGAKELVNIYLLAQKPVPTET